MHRDFHKWENYRYAGWLSQTVYGARGQRRLVYDAPIIINGASYGEAARGELATTTVAALRNQFSGSIREISRS